MPREITLSSHPQHSLIQKQERSNYSYICAVCDRGIYGVGYFCSSSDSCEFQVHLWCAHDFKILKSTIDIEHPSHPHHHLTLLLKSISLKCDACGIMQKGRSYICNDCQYWIHESCAALPPTTDFHHLHHHALSLAYRIPPDYIRFDLKCRICFKILSIGNWLYHCQTCRYAVHINCAVRSDPAMLSKTNVGEGVILFPTKNTVEEMIRSFVDKVGGGAKGEYMLHNANHQLRLVSSSSSSSLHAREEEEEEEDDDDDPDKVLYYGNKSELVCDGCTTPILDKSQKKSSHEYISCADCNYFLHLACSQLPPELPSHPLHERCDRILTLQSCGKLDFVFCWICYFSTNGLFYGCTKCSFVADVKCVSLPDTIKHESHPQHRLKLTTKDFMHACGACGNYSTYDVGYRCDICDIALHASCCLLPAAVNSPTWDKQPLPLTFDASMNHPSSFYYEVCEEEMNPMTWMYHCRDSDVSIHPNCLPTASGWLRNTKLGQQYRVEKVHNHPLAYQLLTKLHCGVCGKRKVYGELGFQCWSKKCEFAMCLDRCSSNLQDAVMIEENSNI